MKRLVALAALGAIFAQTGALPAGAQTPKRGERFHLRS
jgi:hypothetical protein